MSISFPITQASGLRPRARRCRRWVENLRNAALDIEQGVDGFHRRAHGVLCREDAVALFGLSKLADKGKLAAPRYHVWRSPAWRGMKNVVT